MKTQDHTLIHPEDSTNIQYWTKKWGVSNRQLNDAILDTGSLNPNRIRDYLRNKRQSLIFGFIKFLMPKHNAFH